MQFFVSFEMVGLSKTFITNRTNEIFYFFMHGFNMNFHVMITLELLSTITWTKDLLRTVNSLGVSCKANFLCKWFITLHTLVRLEPAMCESVSFTVVLTISRVIAVTTGVSFFHWTIGVLTRHMHIQCSNVAKDFTTCFTWVTITCKGIRQLY